MTLEDEVADKEDSDCSESDLAGLANHREDRSH